jgi:putative heme iron utilization protein
VTVDDTVTNSTAPTASNDPHLGALTIHGDVDTFPGHAELVRTLLAIGRFATLTTVTAGSSGSGTDPGFPYGSLVAYSVLDDGSPLVCISEFAEHTRNAHADNRAGMLLAGLPVDDESDPLDRPRVSLVGHLRPHVPTDDERTAHVALHPGVTDYVDFPDFGWWRLEITSARYVGGFGHMSWVTGADVAAATPDPVLAGSEYAVAHMNDDHADACLDMVRWIAGVRDATSARVHSIDRHGLTLYADLPGAPLATARIAFVDAPLASPDDVRAAVVVLARRARALAEAVS